jgi:hypothetical protein
MRIKHLLSAAMALFAITLYSQNVNLPQPTEASEPLQLEETFGAEGAVDQADFFPFFNIREEITPQKDLVRVLKMDLDLDLLKEAFEKNEDFMDLQLPYFQDEVIDLELYQHDLFADGFMVTTSESQGEAIDITLGHYYHGSVKGHPESQVAFSVFQDEIIGMVTLNGENIVLKQEEGGESYIIYNDKDIAVEMPFSCEELHHNEGGPDINGEGSPESSNCVKVYLECDHALFNNKGGTTATVNWITAVFNNMAALYTAESITTQISQIFVWTTPDSYSTTSSVTALQQFRSLRPSYNGDLAHLAALGGAGLGGVAWLDALCTSYGYAYSNINSTYQTVPTYSWTIMVMTHEMGHNLGSNHTQWCGWPGGAIDNCYTPEGSCSRGPAPVNGGTIMSYCHLTSYGINLANGFGPLPGDKIRQEVSNAACLGTCGTGGCSTPTGLAASNVTTNSANISWNSVSGANSYDLQYRISGASTWTTVNTSNTSYTLTGLSPSTTYNTRVRANCTGQSSSYTSIVNFTTTSAGCSTPTGLATSNITTSTADISWGTVSGAVSYDLQIRLNGTTSWTTFNTTSTSVTITGLASSTTYDVRVRANCTGQSSTYTGIVTFTTTASSSYCTSRGQSASQEWIRRVRANGFDRSSGNDGGYYDATNLVATMDKNAYNLIYFQAGRTGGSRRFYWRVWVDLNQDGDFDDSGELRVSGYSNSTRLLYAYMLIPSSALSGQTRMRVSMRYGGYPQPCQTYSRGEVEDYTINIVGSTQEGADVENRDEPINDWSLAPNPTGDETTLRFQASEICNLDIRITDMYGREVRSMTYEAGAGHHFVELPSQDLETGHYFVQVGYHDKVKILRLIKL